MTLLHAVLRFLLLLHLSRHSLAHDSVCAQPRSTSNGPIIGHTASKRTSVCEYLGIPYARPPLGDLRFAPPVIYLGNETYSALNYASHSVAFRSIANNSRHHCPQPSPKQVIYPNATAQELRIVAKFANQANNHTQSEDCLTLNIWSKSTDRANKPILVFFHGGRYTGGTSNTPFYNGQFLADAEDVVVITVNFRLNIFGFPGAPGYAQNIGLLDQRKAVEWIRDNIASFGGNPSKITLLGQSSGAVGIDIWAYSYRSDPIVSGLISHSGNVFSFPIHNASLAASNWYNISGRLGCGTSGDVMTCMRSKSFESIREAAALVRPPPSNSIARSIPVFQVTVDNVTVFDDYQALSESGLFACIPYLHGNTNYESGYYKITAYGTTNATAPESVWTDFQLGSFTCPTAVEAANRARFGVPTFRFRYFGDWDNLRLHPGSGAYHGSDINMIIGNSEEVSGLPPSSEQVQLTKVMMKAWASFADDPVHGLTEQLGWPRYQVGEPTLIRLGYNNSPIPDFVLPSEYDAPCDTFK